MLENVSRLLKMLISLAMSFLAYYAPFFALCVREEHIDYGYSFVEFDNGTELIRIIILSLWIVGIINLVVSYLTGFSVIKSRLFNNISVFAIWVLLGLYMAFGISKLLEVFLDGGLYTDAYIPFIIGTGLLIAYLFVPVTKSKRK